MVESYWDWLPLELMLKYWVDVQKEELRRQLLQEIHKLPEAWGLGPIELPRRQGILQIKGVHVEYKNQPGTAFLGQGSLDNALRRIHHVKSFFP